MPEPEIIINPLPEPEEEVIAEEEVETTEKAEPFETGLGRMLDRYQEKPAEEEEEKPAEEEEEVVKPTEEEVVVKEPVELSHLNEDDKTKVASMEVSDLRKFTLETINDMKNHQKKAHGYKLDVEKNAKTAEFIEGLKKDFTGTYKEYQAELGLPELSHAQHQIAEGGDVSARVAQWQETELIKQIEKKHKLDEGEFVFDPSEAYDAKSPSSTWRIATAKKEAELMGEYQVEKDKETAVMDTMVEQRNSDLVFLKDTYFAKEVYETPEAADADFKSYLKRIDESSEKMKEGKITPEINPFSLRNIFRGMFYDELKDKAILQVADKIHKQYNTLGLFLPDEEKEPTDATKPAGETIKPKIKDDKRKAHSPMLRAVSYYTK